jgi:hypothetical protein
LEDTGLEEEEVVAMDIRMRLSFALSGRRDMLRWWVKWGQQRKFFSKQRMRVLDKQLQLLTSKWISIFNET